MKSLSGKLGIILTVLLVILAYAEGWGADWKLYNGDEEYRRYYDGGSIKKVLGIVRVWEKWIPSQKTVDKQVKTFGAKYQDWEFTLYLVAIDCMDGKRRLLLYTQYDKSGKAITTFEYSETDSPWQFIAPETVGETLLKAVCPK